MGLRKGMTNNPNGRPKGSKNKVTISMKGVLKDFLTSRVTDLENLYTELQPNEKANFIIKLLPFVLPKMSEISTEQQIKLLMENLEKLDDEQLEKFEELITTITENKNDE